ncbi:MAG TPA: outer membrane lipoprotein-sorting protein [Candidatus Saccharicenans sp.]|jgi:outer membrane lipoprotein-sorting protein|nr:outer membrane lipoprotein-sorting protein [Candidatus Saccharicenans sp.]HRD02640.1 outer membrane lipoprotein-sorting protein [Candidatus Saccharicenans sp.]
MNHKTSKLAFLLVLFIMALNMLPAGAQAEKDILEKMLTAMGGREALSQVKDSKTTGTMDIIQFGLTFPLTIYQKEPDKFRLEMEVEGYRIVQVYDGQKAQVTNPQTGEIIDLPSDQTKGMKKEALGNQAWLEPAKHGITYTYKGEETVDGKKCYVLEQKFPDGDFTTFYIEASTYLPYLARTIGVDASGSRVETENRLTDYRQIGKTIVPFVITINQAGTEYARMTFSEIIYNTGLQDSFFVLK